MNSSLFDKGKGTDEVWSRLLELKDEPNIELKRRYI